MRMWLGASAVLVLCLSAGSQEEEVKGLKWDVKDKVLFTPDDAGRVACLDAIKLAETWSDLALCSVRYISMHNIPSSLREVYWARVSDAVNRVSRRRSITVPAACYLDGEPVVLRINLRDYYIPPEAWDGALADADSYFHEGITLVDKLVTETSKKGWVVRDWPGGVWKDGINYPAWPHPRSFQYQSWEDVPTSATVREVRRRETRSVAGMGPNEASYLIRALQSTVPLMRADQFIDVATRAPVYYKLLQIKTLDDAKELALFDKRADRLLNSKATVVESGRYAEEVAENNRLISATPTVYGTWWETFDFKTSVGKQNIVNNFLQYVSVRGEKPKFKRDAGEIIFPLPNGLHAYVLVNGDDELVDEGDIHIVKDNLSKNRIVKTSQSCIWCHKQGINPFDNDFKVAMTPKNLIDLGLDDGGDPARTLQLQEYIKDVFESTDMAAIVKADNVRYADKVKLVTAVGKSKGVLPPTNAALTLQTVERYTRVHLDAKALTYEVGVADLDVMAALTLKIDGANNGVLLRRMEKPPQTIRRDQLEESYPDFYRRVKAWEAAKRMLKPGGMN